MYVVGWRLVERCQLSCVSCLGGVGDNVMFTLRLTRLLMLRSALLQVTSNERECGIQAAPRDGYIGQTMVVQNADTLVQMMSIDIWLKSCNACETREVQSYKKKLKKQSSLSQEFRVKKKGPKHDILRDHRQNELATVGKTGGILWAAYHVVIHIINIILCNYLYIHILFDLLFILWYVYTHYSGDLGYCWWF